MKKKNLKKRLNDNKEFITNVCEKRFEYTAKRLLKSEKLKGDEFLLKEYFHGVKLLNKEPNEMLLKIKKEADLQAKFSHDIKRDKSKIKSRTETKRDIGRE
ncbi:hypothetical protein O6B72_05405 [Campylobacter ureolyticus]|uniref:hypothetical protein n=1 Tax=Campylobacter ureolyticus TaxID=827 RepID=UPI0022B2E5D2|nr:hypothetical protein [Campylobacter ureolyticus]MCZ6156256.1 hypothetical protein [Campylobacter ureolyticus]